MARATDPVRRPTRTPVRWLLLVALLGARPGARAGAQEPVPPPAQPLPLPPALAIVGDTVPRLERPNGALLRAGSTVYDLTATRGGQTSPLGVRTVEVTETSLGGLPSWLLAESRTGTVLTTTDSLVVSRAELVPERWAATSGTAQLGASFTRDSLYAALQSYQGRTAFTLPVGPTLLVTPAMVERVVELLPLRPGYRAATAIAMVELGSPRIVPAELAVDREETVQIAGLPVDCWVVTLRAGASEERLWVAKAPTRVVRTEQAIAGGLLTATARP